MAGHIPREPYENRREAFDGRREAENEMQSRQVIEGGMKLEAEFADNQSEITKKYEENTEKALSLPVRLFLGENNDKAWEYIRSLLQCETAILVCGYSAELAGVGMDDETKERMLSRLKLFARAVVEEKAREESREALSRMTARFTRLFNHKFDSSARVWTGKEDIDEISKTARLSCLELLSVLAAIRLDDEADNIKDTLVRALVDSADPGNQLASSIWEQVQESRTLLTPVQCRDVWEEFFTATEHDVQAAKENAKILRKKKERKMGYLSQCFRGAGDCITAADDCIIDKIDDLLSR